MRFKGSATNLLCFRSFLATNLSITLPSNISLTNNIVLSSPGSPSFERSLELASIGRTLDLIAGDGNCFFRALSKELLGDQRFHQNLRHVIVHFILNNSLLFHHYYEHLSMKMM